MRKIVFFVIALAAFSQVCAQEYRVDMQGTAGWGDNSPLWLHSNRYGLSTLENSNGYVRAGLFLRTDTLPAHKFGYGYGVDMAVASQFTSTVVLQQAYLEGRWLHGTLTVGSKEYPMELKDNRLSSGSQTLGVNARPVPQVRLALPDYWTVPLTGGWLSLKGHLAFGMTTDNAWQRDFVSGLNKYTEDTYVHTKAGYLRIGSPSPKAHFNAELGLEMAAQFAGNTFQRTAEGAMRWVHNDKGLSAFWHAFIPGGADQGDTESNVEGNHLGSWVARLNLDYDRWGVSVYADHFFEDHSSMFFLDYDGYGSGTEKDVRKDNRYVLYDLKDMMLGAEVRLKSFHWIDKVVLEYLYSKYQSGPVYHDHRANVPDHIGGRDDYYNNCYFTGWQHWGQVMGNPLYLSPLYNTDGAIEVTDNRFVSWHLGLSGHADDCLSYRLLATYVKGHGTYSRPFIDARTDFSLLAEATYSAPEKSSLSGWSVTGAFGMDAGDRMGDNFGFQVTITKSGLLNLLHRK